jgi:hypothetical protein
MLEFFKKLFSTKSEETAAPYKVEAPVAPKVEEFPFPSKSAKKPAAKKVATAKPKAPRKPKAPKV